jgi:hypothetical protein
MASRKTKKEWVIRMIEIDNIEKIFTNGFQENKERMGKSYDRDRQLKEYLH